MTKEEKRQYDIKYRAANPDKVKENNKSWRLKNKGRMKIYHKDWRKANSIRIRGYVLKGKYGLSLDGYNELLVKQNHKCAICDKDQTENKRPFVVDHNHKTGKVRGLLCFRCNTGIGQLTDSVEVLLNAIKYLTK